MTLMTTFPSMTRVAGGALIASASSAFRDQVLHNLNGRCRPVQQALGGAEALSKLEKGDWQVLFLDRRVPDLDTDELIAIIQRRFPGTQVVLLDSDVAFSGAETKADTGRGVALTAALSPFQVGEELTSDAKAENGMPQGSGWTA